MNQPFSPSELKQRCHTFISGHRACSPADEFAAMARWCETNQIEHDTYGDGALIQDFERKIADLLGLEAAVFVASGTLTQVTALRLASTERGRPLVAMHSTAHILKHERSNYQLLDHFKALAVGDPFRPWGAEDLKASPDPIGAALYELPMREIGGQLPGWEALQTLKRHCKERDIHLHLDGARLWEAAAAYGRSYREIAEGFDTVYVSFYKGIAGLGGAMLLGSRNFIDVASVWMKRQGGNLFRRSPYVVAAAMQFDERIAAMPAYFQRTQWLYESLQAFPRLRPNPAQPQANMLHIHLPCSVEKVTTLRNRIALEQGIWLFGAANHAPLPDTCYFEWYIGDNLLHLPDSRVLEVLRIFDTALA